MTRANANDTRYALMFTFEPSLYTSDQGEFVARAMELDESNKLRNPRMPTWEGAGGDYLDNLVVEVQAWNYDGTRTIGGFGVFYESNGHEVIDAARAKRMAATLSRIETKLAKMRETRGEARDFGAFVSRVAEILKIDTIARVEDRHHSHSYADWSVRFLNTGPGADAITSMVTDWLSSAE